MTKKRTSSNRQLAKLMFSFIYGLVLSSVTCLVGYLVSDIVSSELVEGTWIWWLCQLLIVVGLVGAIYLVVTHTALALEQQVYEYLVQLKKDSQRAGFWHIQGLNVGVVVLSLIRSFLFLYLAVGGMYVVDWVTNSPHMGQLILACVTISLLLLIFVRLFQGNKRRVAKLANTFVVLLLAWLLYESLKNVWVVGYSFDTLLNKYFMVEVAIVLLTWGRKKVKQWFGWQLLSSISPKKVALIYGESMGHLMRNHKQYFPIETNYQLLANITHMEYRQCANKMEVKTESDTFYVMETNWITFINTNIRCRYSLMELSVSIPIHHRYEVEGWAVSPYGQEDEPELAKERRLWGKRPVKRVFFSEQVIGCNHSPIKTHKEDDNEERL